MNPISPNEINEIYVGPVMETLISKINEAISIRNWHHSSVQDENLREDYYQILLSLEAGNEKISNALVDTYKLKGWDCAIARCYSGHGPHYCFFVSKKHFIHA